jgi:hypothetical protein
MLTDIVVDLETLSASPNAAIISIGAVSMTDDREPSMADVYNPGEMGVSPENLRKPAFYCNVRKSTGEISLETVFWWLGQDGERSPGYDAQAALLTPGRTESEALALFDAWMHAQHGSGKWADEFVLWAHATFDPPVLEQAYLRHPENKIGWPHRQIGDVRTVLRQAKMSGHEPNLTEEKLILHHALHDAYREALSVQKAAERTGSESYLNLLGINEEIQDYISTQGAGVPTQLVHLLSNLDWSLKR